MKNLRFLFIFAAFALAFTSCEDDADRVDANAKTGGLVENLTSLINYVVGDNGTYTSKVKIYQDVNNPTTKVNVYKQFVGALGASNRALLKSVDVSGTKVSFAEASFSYEDLIAGLTVDGTALPTNDADLQIGDEFILTYEGVTSNGAYVANGNTAVAVSTRFAGIYTVLESAYIHPAAGPQGDFNGRSITIKSVDQTTYQVLANGPFTMGQDPDNEFFFTINDDLTITIPKEYNGKVQTVWGGDEVANCQDDPGLLPNANCGASNYAEKQEDGKDIIVMSHGYIRDNGTREFYYKLQKQ